MVDEGAFRILTVCIGNMCRSPLAERLLRLRLAEQVPPDRFVVESAGVGATAGSAMEPHAAEELARLGGDSADFAARRVTAELAGEADLVLAATRDIRTRTLQEQPRALKRAFTLLEFADLCALAPSDVDDAKGLVAWAANHRNLVTSEQLDIEDPIGQSAAVHREVADLIDEHVQLIVKALAPRLARG